MVYIIPVPNRSNYTRTILGSDIVQGLPSKMHTIQWDKDGNGIIKAYYKEDISKAIENARNEAASYGVKNIEFGTPRKISVKDSRWTVTNW